VEIVLVMAMKRVHGLKILADKLELPLLNMSACAASNYFVCYQLEYVLKYNPKIIIIVLAR